MTTLGTYARPLFDARAGELGEHAARCGGLPHLSPDELRAVATASGLTGRGGAGFPFGRKLDAVAKAGRRRGACVIANGAEGEPASRKDAFLLYRAPHLVLDGLELAARAVGARERILYAPSDVIRDVLRPAVAARADLPPPRFVASPERFVSGQESAAVAAAEGRAALPSTAPPLVIERGVDRGPTLVSNVETLAHFALAARYGSDWFRSIGLPPDPGTRLLTVSGAVAAPGVYEVPTGRTLGSLLDLAGEVEPVQALLIGGYHGGWVPWNARTAALPHTRESLAAYRAAPGAGVVIALASRQCGLRLTADIARYLADESAGQCGPCRNGLPALAGRLHDLAYGRSTPATVREIDRVCALVDRRGACAHPDGTARLAASALDAFPDEIEQHLRGGCSGPAGAPVTTRLHIDWTRCDGRGLCVELLPEILDGDDWGYPLARTGERAPEVPPMLAGHARRAVRECPRLALQLREDRRPRGR